MSNIIKAYCPLDCPDVCAFNLHVNNGKIEKVAGDKQHEYTQGFVCSKADKLLQRLQSADRITYPLRKVNGKFMRVSWQVALNEIANRLNDAKHKYGPTSVMYYSDAGSAGILRDLEKRFFNAFGGATFTEGTLCWGAVCGAQKQDFGEYRAHLWEDMLNSKTIVLWGRNISVTNLHMVPFIRKAQQQGAFIITIDPNKTQTAALSDQHLSIRPGMDGVFAMGIAHIILQNGWADLNYISQYTENFEAYLKQVKEFTPDVTSEMTGIDKETLRDFAYRYTKAKPACIWLGYGMQRYNDSGQTISAINALGAISGNIGISGGGVNHASQYNKRIIKGLTGDELVKEVRIFKKAKTAEAILSAEPPVEVLFVTAANPVAQLPNTNKVMEAFHKVPFKVVSDFFMTDTARLADIILPCASIFEKEDVITSSWNPYIGYNPRIVPPRGEAKADYEIFQQLAKLMQLSSFGEKTPQDWLKQALEPAEAYGITLEELKIKEIKNPLWQEIAWKEGDFLTDSGKFKLLGQFQAPELKKGLRLLTTHQAKTMHSQFYNLRDDTLNYPYVYIPISLAEGMYLSDMEKVQIETEYGELTALVKITEGIHSECVVVHQGSWVSLGGGVNQLTGDSISDIGDGTSYNEVICTLQKIL